MKPAIVLCSRSHSSRVPNKCFITYQGIPHIEHLVVRLLEADIPIFVAVPENEVNRYMFLMDKYPKKVFISSGCDDNPLARIYKTAKQNSISHIVRVTHDKIFVDTSSIKTLLDRCKKEVIDYAYSSDFIPGTGFEIISFDALEDAFNKFTKPIEHVSYAIKAVATKQLNYKIINSHSKDVRLLVDYQEDVKLMDLLFTALGANCSLDEVLNFIDNNQWLKKVNELPLVSIYTCAYNAEKWIDEAMGSVSKQDIFSRCEYILIDDHSIDKTILKMGKFCQTYKNASYYKNIKNVGLSSSSNRALKLAKGKYIIRLDADDYFLDRDSISTLVKEIEKQSVDVIYPSYKVSKSLQKTGDLEHHIGGALFNTSAINHIKFTDKLRGHDSLDVFLRAKDQLKIGYLHKPIFFYRQHGASLSKNNLSEREKIKQRLLYGKSGEAQI